MQGRVACLVDLGALVGLKARPPRPEGRMVMLQRTQGDLGICLAMCTASQHRFPGEVRDAVASQTGAAVAPARSSRGDPVKLIDPELLSRAIDNMVEA